jgi:hypothetical protein
MGCLPETISPRPCDTNREIAFSLRCPSRHGHNPLLHFCGFCDFLRPTLFNICCLTADCIFWTGSLVRIPTHFGQQSDFSRTVIRSNSDTRPI